VREVLHTADRLGNPSQKWNRRTARYTLMARDIFTTCKRARKTSGASRLGEIP
jgi:hypothetical protein